jgi:glucose-1-phosphate thymidylyltransferase
MKVLILAAGYGTRLYPHTKNFPKPLLKVNRKPIIQYLTDKLENISGISKIIVVTNGRFFNNFANWQKGLKLRNKICIINDLTRSPKDKLGAIGDMFLVFDKEGFDDDYLVLGGDNFFDEPLGDFVFSAKEKAPAITIGVCDIKNKQEARHYGVVSLSRNNRIVSFQEKPAHPKSSIIAMCLYYFPKKTVGLIKKYLADPKNSKDAVGSYINWLSKNKTVYGFIFRDAWFDIGHVHTYNKIKELTKGVA